VNEEERKKEEKRKQSYKSQDGYDEKIRTTAAIEM
jgi:hypothetical protein